MGLRKNLIYNGGLTATRYIFPLIIFPYITRVLGVSNIGIIGFVDSIVTYSILISSMGMNIIGIREIARNNGNKEKLNQTFSELFTIHAIFTFVSIIIYLIFIFSIPELYQYKKLFYIGISKILFSLFLVEWFFSGTENFRYITIRSFFVQVVYVFSIFIWVKEPTDFDIYFILTCGITIISALLNLKYILKFVTFIFIGLKPMKYVKSFLLLGSYTLLTSSYTTLNISYLGFVSTEVEVGYYATALKFYYIILAAFSAFTAVMMPRMSSLLGKENFNEFKGLIKNSFLFTFTFSFPISFSAIVLAPQVIHVVAGDGYEGSILLLRIIMLLVFIVGVSQINAIQILLPLKKDSLLLKTAFVGAISGIILNILLVNKFESIGAALVLLISETIVAIVLAINVYKAADIFFPFKECIIHLLCSIPYLLICLLIQSLHYSSIYTITFSIILSGIYFIISQVFILKNMMITNIIVRTK